MVSKTRKEEILLRKEKIRIYEELLTNTKSISKRNNIIRTLAIHKSDIGVDLNLEEQRFMRNLTRSLDHEISARKLNTTK